jgi:hypothetical protein
MDTEISEACQAIAVLPAGPLARKTHQRLVPRDPVTGEALYNFLSHRTRWRSRADGRGFGMAINHRLKPFWSVVRSMAAVPTRSRAQQLWASNGLPHRENGIPLKKGGCR